MDLTIYSYGYSEIIYHTLNAIAMFRNSTFYPTVIETILLLVTVFYAVQMAASGRDGGWRLFVRKVIGMVLFVNILMLPTTSMFIKDHVEKHLWKVDNIPLAFALPIGMVESFGHLLTIGFDQVFTRIDSKSSTSYYHHGTVFGARLAKEVSQAKIRDPEVVANMHSFMERCVILPTMIGHQWTKEELVTTDNMWKLVSSRAGTFARMDMVIKGDHSMPTCKAAVAYFGRKFRDEQKGLLAALAWKFRGAGRKGEYNQGFRQLNRHMKENIATLYGGGGNVDSIIKHNMMINSLNSYRAGKYPAVKAMMQQEANGILSGDLAQKTLTGSLAVFKVLVYSAFIFLFPLLILSGGIKKYSMWIMAAFALTLWPSLFTILNMIVDFAYEPASIVSYSSWATESKKFDSIGATALALTILIPVLSFWISRIGEGGIMHLAGSIMAGASGAAAAGASEQTSGSRSHDNINIGNSTRNMTSANKFDDSQQYFSGERNWNNSDGSTSKVTGDGTAIYTAGQGRTNSSGEASFQVHNGVQASLQESFTQAEQAAAAETVSTTESLARTNTKAASVLANLCENEIIGTSNTIDLSTEEGQTVNNAKNEILALNKTNTKGIQLNAEAWMSGNVSTGVKLFGNGGTVEAGGKTSVSALDHQLTENSASVNIDKSTSESLNKVRRALTSEQFTGNKSSDSVLGREYRASYEETQRFEKQRSMRLEEMNTFNKALEHSQTMGSSSGQDMYQTVLETYAKEQNISVDTARAAVERRDPAVMRVFNRLVQQETDAVLTAVRNDKAAIGGSAGKARLRSFAEEEKKGINSNVVPDIDEIAKQTGIIAPGAVKQAIAAKKKAVTQKVNNQTASTTKTINASTASSHSKTKVLNKGSGGD